MNDLEQKIDLFLEGLDGRLSKEQVKELPELLHKSGYQTGVFESYIYSKNEGNSVQILMPVNLETGKEGCSYLNLHNSQREDFERAIHHPPVGGRDLLTLIKAAFIPAAGVTYATMDLPYSSYVAGASILAFFIGGRIAIHSILKKQYHDSIERFKQFNPETDTKKALYLAFNRNLDE